MDNDAPLVVSYSQIATFRRCQQAYRYSYIDNLAPKIDAPAPMLGTVLHKYFEEFYSRMAELGGARAHGAALASLSETYTENLRTLAQTAAALDQTEVAEDLLGVLPRAQLIADRYFTVHGDADANLYKVLKCEVEYEFGLYRDVKLHGVIDLITRDASGSVALWEHKTAKSPPPPRHRLRDLQTLIYAAVAEELFGYEIDRVIWNNVRTKVPTEPRVLKSGDLSRDKSMDTTWYTYARAVERIGQDVDAYADMKELLIDRERDVFYPRYELPRVAEERILLQDVIATARHISRLRTRFAADPTIQVVRNIGRECDWCSFNRLCDATLTGGGVEMELARYYEPRKGRDGGRPDTDSDEEDDDPYIDLFGR